MGGDILVYKGNNRNQFYKDPESLKKEKILEKKEKISSFNVKKKNKWNIVGFDPGLTVGIAILNLNGELVSLKSCKEVSKSVIINHIINHGKTLIIASDVYPPPKMVKKLATSLNAKIYSPKKVISVENKIEIVENYLNQRSIVQRPENAHERDSLAAAIKTYKNYQNKLKQIDKRVEGLEISLDELDEIRAQVIKGNTITSAIDNVLIKFIEIEYEKNKIVDEVESLEGILEPKFKGKDIGEKKIFNLEKRIKRQENIIQILKEENKTLRDENKDYKQAIDNLESKIDKLHYQYSKKILNKKEITSKIALIKAFQEKYIEEKALRIKLEENLKSIKQLDSLKQSKNFMPVKMIESFTKEGIRDACQYWKIKRGDVVLLSSSRGGGSHTASLLTKIGVKAVITNDKMSHTAEEVFEVNKIPILDAQKISINQIDEFAVIKKTDLDREIEKWKLKLKNKRNKEEKNKIISIIDEYRAKRKRQNDDT
ncbi:MAG: DUF460 domain-containing protein [Methanobacteriaceae archaeon]|nr:DUF460 domain-containing protein [Methanobacteriaceae archaeon]